MTRPVIGSTAFFSNTKPSRSYQRHAFSDARAQLGQQRLTGILEPGRGPAVHPDAGDLVIFVGARGTDGWHHRDDPWWTTCLPGRPRLSATIRQIGGISIAWRVWNFGGSSRLSTECGAAFRIQARCGIRAQVVIGDSLMS